MILSLRSFLLLAVLLCASTPFAEAQVEGSAPFSSAGTTRKEVTAFLAKLQQAVTADDRTAVAALVHFPLRAWTGKTTVEVRNRKQLLTDYPRIFTSSLRKTIAEARVDQAFANWQGVMFEGGRIWIRPNGSGRLGIVTINEPIPAASGVKP